MAIKPSKYIIRKQQTGSLNAGSTPQKNQPINDKYRNYSNLTNSDEDTNEDYPEYSEENLLNISKYKSFIYYSTIKDTFWYFTIRANPFLFFSNSVMKHKYETQDIYSSEVGYEAKYVSLNFSGDNNNHKEIESYLKTPTPITINDFKTLPLGAKKQHLLSYYARVKQDDSKLWFGISTLSALYLMNKDINQIKNILHHYPIDDKIEILEFTIKNISKSTCSDYLHMTYLSQNLIQPFLNSKDVFEGLLEYYVMKEQRDNDTNNLVTTKRQTLKF